MIGADKHFGSSLIFTADFCAAVRAPVKEYVYIGMTVTGDDHRAAAKMTGDKVACCGDFTLVTDEHPGIGKNIAHLAPEQCRARINRAMDAAFLDEIVPVSGGISGAH